MLAIMPGIMFFIMVCIMPHISPVPVIGMVEVMAPALPIMPFIMVCIMSHMPPIAFIGMVEVIAAMPWMPGIVPDIGIVPVTVPVLRIWAPGVPIGIIR